MIVKINNEIVNFTGNPQLGRNIKESPDTGKITIESTREARYEMYSTVDITTPHNNIEQYLVQVDDITQLNATEYRHDLSLFENLSYFATIYPADRSFTTIGQTLEEILTAYERELEEYWNIHISWDTMTQTDLDEEIPFKNFTGQSFSTILISLFRKLTALPKVNRVGNVWDIYPQYHCEKNNLIPKKSISKISRQNNVDYATQVKSQLKNAVNEKTVGEITWFPSINGYVLPRASSLEKITSKLRYELDSDIVTILKVEAIGLNFSANEVALNNPPADVFFTNYDIDLTSQVVQDEIWDTLSVTSSTSSVVIVQSNNVKNNIRYKTGDRYITNLFEKDSDGIIFQENTEFLLNAVKRALYLDINDNTTGAVYGVPEFTDSGFSTENFEKPPTYR